MKTDELLKKWQPVLEHAELDPIKGAQKRAVTAMMLENQEIAVREQGSHSDGAFAPSILGETAPTNSGVGPAGGTNTGIAIVDPVLISLVRRTMPNLIAHDIAGVQPMSGPSGLIFAMRSRYTSQSGTEALFNEANGAFSGTHVGANTEVNIIDGVVDTDSSTTGNQHSVFEGTDPNDAASGAGYTVGTGMDTAIAEQLGSDNFGFNEMAFSIEKVTVTAKSRALKAEYSTELAQDLKALHGLDAEQELSNILTTEILSEINREVVRTVNYTAEAGAQKNVTTAGTFDLDTDSNGRWSVEKFKGLMFNIERDANELAKRTRRGKGNILITSSDVASALQMAGVLDYNPALATNLNVDDTGNTFAGILNGRIKVYIDPFFADSTNNYYTIGYKGSNAFDAGIFYCPYVPLQMVRAVGENTFQPKIGFKTRYGMIANPFANDSSDFEGKISFAKKNKYYRRVNVQNLM